MNLKSWSKLSSAWFRLHERRHSFGFTPRELEQLKQVEQLIHDGLDRVFRNKEHIYPAYRKSER